MADLHDLIERIQVTLASSRSPGKDELRDLHGTLAEQIRGANRRLRECDALLAKGHRTEAIQLAEQEPALLDLVAILDFPELPEWNDFVAELGLTVAPELLIDVAADLNHAYSDEGPLEQQLRKFRLCSLARTPLRTRISLLKKIAELDAGNPVWETDLRSYEEVRLRQIKDELKSANQKRDLKSLRDLANELRGEWTIPPTKQLIDRATQAMQAIHDEETIKRLTRLTQDLHEAFEDDDHDRTTRLAAEWQSLAKKCSTAEEFPALRKRVRAALDWLKQQKVRLAQRGDFEQALKRLQRSIDGGHDAEELERRYKAATRFAGFEIPAAVRDEYDEAIADLQRRKKMRTIITISSIAGGVLLLGMIILVWKLASS